MKAHKIKDLMVPLSEYATVSQDATLKDAVLALEDAQDKFRHKKYLHRAILVLDETGQPIGKMSKWDIIRAIEPRYSEITDSSSLTRFGLNAGFIRSIIESQGLWQKPLDNLCDKASQTYVKDIMYTPAEGEFVDEEASLNAGIHQLVMGHHQSLLVTRGKEVIGVLRLTDVFTEVCTLIKNACNS